MRQDEVSRRAFVGLAAGACAVSAAAPGTNPIPIIDTHIHLFDPRRSQGVPWPERTDTVLYRPALPDRLERVTAGLNVVGAIEVEASPWLEDNQWVLDVAAKNPIIVGTVGDLEPGKPEFGKQLERFHKNPLFRGIRYGNLWGRDLTARSKERAFIEDLKLLAQADLALDTANPDAPLLRDIVRISNQVPGLRIVIDHLPHVAVPTDKSGRAAYEEDLRELGKRPQIYVKLSEVVAGRERGQQLKPSEYIPTLERLFEVFGEDRVLYGSDWPNIDTWCTYQEELQAVQKFFAGMSRAVQEKYFWKNSVKAYRWIKRDERQPSP